MPLDPSIPLSVQSPRFNNPFEVLGQFQQQRQQQDESALRQQVAREQLADVQARRQAQEQEEQRARLLADAYQQSFNTQTGSVDRSKLQGLLTQQGLGPAIPDLLKGLDEAESANAKARQAKQDAEAAEMTYATTLGKQILAADFNPAIVNGILTMAESHGHDIGQYRQLFEQQPEQFKSFVSNLVNPPKAPEAVTLSPGQQRFGPDGKLIASVPPTPEGFSLSPGQTRYGADGKPIASRPDKPDTPNFQRVEVTGPDGQKAFANYDPRTGTFSKVSTDLAPPPSDAQLGKQQGKNTISNVFSAISELSEKINTGRGTMATLKGKEERAKAQINLNDDVAEYEALISGFTPIIARAVGHTGVLTQQDVDSVKAMFPKPEDSKTLRDRKIARVQSLLVNTEGGKPAGGGSVMMTAPDGRKFSVPADKVDAAKAQGWR